MLLENFKNQYLRPISAALIFDDGEILWGYGIGEIKSVIAELCFNTSQSGYQETLTDPSYAKQIITFTFPHIGIVGTNNQDQESGKIYAEGCVINQKIDNYSNWRAEEGLDSFLKNNNIPGINGIDTRYLTRKLSNEGAKKVALVNFGEDQNSFEKLKLELNEWNGLENLDLATVVSTKKEYNWHKGLWNNEVAHKSLKSYPIVCLDFGIKQNILRNLKELNFETTILPATSNIGKILEKNPKGIFLSNGPGDPDATIKIILPTIKELIKLKIPIFGICLGHQIISLALGAKTKKMYQGHRGANQPVKNLNNQKVEITSQNHGFEVDRSSLPSNVLETHISLFDGSNEGIKHKKLPIFSVQYHPEASPGPHDSSYLFREFYKLVESNA
ncbi:MAG: carbamoyl phosphate synthase small subunit [Pelagibacteraceae bacterium]|nr:carbamoyl phosphate synthase small subunit [Pelagibacteraceae bacterium]|tara:strand:+ start:6919 stop:8082 length:1164 start_codon:yes stop_codon:yes gene_type:complete